MKTNRKQVISGLRKKLKDHMTTEGKDRMTRALERYQKEVVNVINMYNTYQLERYPGDIAKRSTMNYANDPLIRTRKYLDSWKYRIKYLSGNKVIGVLYNNVYYAHWLEEGTVKMAPYRVGIIAFQQAKRDIEEILSGRR